MAKNNKNTIRKIMIASVWLLLGAGVIVLFVAAMGKKDTQSLARIEISISGVQNHYFIDKKDVKNILEKVHKKPLNHAVINSLDLVSMERELQKEKWIKNAEIFIDNNNVLQVKVLEREPVARVFTITGESFYLDSSLMRLPLSKKFSARLPVFTSFPTDVIILTKADSALLRDIRLLSEFIEKDEFWMAQIDQVDITPNNTFELIPKVGNQVIRFGDMQNYKEKFNNLLAFYKQVQVRAGWNKYSVLDVQYKNQVVAVKRDAREIKADSVRAIQIMKNIIAEAQKKTNDTSNIQLKHENEDININESRAREEIPEQNDVPGTKTANSSAINNISPASSSATGKKITSTPAPATKQTIPVAAPVKKPIVQEKPKKEAVKNAVKVVKKEVKPKEKPKAAMSPKAVMPPPGDY